jgi:hypothetical protein
MLVRRFFVFISINFVSVLLFRLSRLGLVIRMRSNKCYKPPNFFFAGVTIPVANAYEVVRHGRGHVKMGDTPDGSGI